jgi:hypothetical protein
VGEFFNRSHLYPMLNSTSLKPKFSLVRGALLAGIILSGAIAQAQTYTVNFGGYVSSKTGTAFTGVTAGDATTGTPFSTVATFNSTPTSSSTSATSGSYSYTSGGVSITTTVGAHTLTSPTVWLRISNDSGANGFQIENSGDFVTGAFNIQNFQFMLYNNTSATNNPFTSTALSSIANNYSISNFGDNHSMTIGTVGLADQLGGQITSYSVSAIPEPSTYAAMAGAAILGFAIWRRRQTKVAVGAV